MLSTSSLPQRLYFDIPADTIRCRAMDDGCWRDGQVIPAGTYKTLAHHLTRGFTICICPVEQSDRDLSGVFYCPRTFELQPYRVQEEPACSQ